MTQDEIAELLKLSKRYVRDKLVKSPDFPRPAVFLSQKNRRWDAQDVSKWIESSKARIAR